jgi:hypothetical protein
MLLNKADKDKKVFIDGEGAEKVADNTSLLEEKVEPQQPLSDDITLLKVPEIIWLKAHENLKNKNLSNENIDLSFLSKLMKYGKKLQYKRLKNVIIENLFKNTQDTDIVGLECKVIKAKLEKYEKKEFLKKAIHKYLKLITKYTDQKNKILSYLVNIVIEKSSDEENKDEIYKYLIQSIEPYIDQNDIIQNYTLSHNVSLIKFLFENTIYTHISLTTLNLENVINKIIDAIIIGGLQSGANEYFNLYWRFLVYNKNQDIEQIYENLANLVKNKKSASSFYHMLLRNLCAMIEDDIRIFPQKFNKYIDKIDTLLKSAKITDITILKDIWKYMLEILLNSYINGLPKDMTYYKVDFDNEFLADLKALRVKFSAFLCNYTSILTEIQKARYKDRSDLNELFNKLKTI